MRWREWRRWLGWWRRLGRWVEDGKGEWKERGDGNWVRRGGFRKGDIMVGRENMREEGIIMQKYVMEIHMEEMVVDLEGIEMINI